DATRTRWSRSRTWALHNQPPSHEGKSYADEEGTSARRAHSATAGIHCPLNLLAPPGLPRAGLPSVPRTHAVTIRRSAGVEGVPADKKRSMWKRLEAES